MPRLLLFAPCERVIFGHGDKSASLIIILQQLQIQSEIPKDAMLIINFSVFSQWYRSSGDEGKIFEQRVALVSGNEKPILENITAFQMTEKLHRIAANFSRFPTLEAGEYDLTLSIRPQGESQWSQPVASYPITMVKVPPLQPLVQ
jgi:hypothetical protein